MKKLDFNGDERALENLGKVQNEIDSFLANHTNELDEDEHSELRELLCKRANALSEATGKEIHSLFD